MTYYCDEELSCRYRHRTCVRKASQMKNRLFITAAALAIAMSGAQAADLPVDPPPLAAPAPADDWSGFYLGIHGGYGFGETEVTAPGAVFEYDIDGWLDGVQAGYNFQSGMWLFGVEADIAISGIDGSGAIPQGPTVTTDIDWLATIRARAGLHYDQWMPYLTGGVAFADVEHTATPPTVGLPASDTLVGWTVGGGVEAMFNPNWTAKLEYLYVDLEDFDILTGAAAPVPVTFDNDFHVIRAGLNYHF
jgi:outer membrane immunogenic protein